MLCLKDFSYNPSVAQLRLRACGLSCNMIVEQYVLAKPIIVGTAAGSDRCESERTQYIPSLERKPIRCDSSTRNHTNRIRDLQIRRKSVNVSSNNSLRPKKSAVALCDEDDQRQHTEHANNHGDSVYHISHAKGFAADLEATLTTPHTLAFLVWGQSYHQA